MYKKIVSFFTSKIVIIFMVSILCSQHLSGYAFANKNLSKQISKVLTNNEVLPEPTPQIPTNSSLAIDENKNLNYDKYTLEKTPDDIKKAIFENDANDPVRISYDGIENLNSVTVENEDGTNSLTIFPYDIKYIEDGCVKFITDDIIKSENVDYDYQNSEGSTVKYFSKDPTTGVRLDYKNSSVELAPLFDYTNVPNERSSEYNEVSQTNFYKNKNGITYDKIFTDNIAIEYKSIANGIKEDIILSKYDGTNKFHFKINTNGLVPGTMEAKQSNIPLIDPKTKEEKLIIGQIIAYDSVYNKNMKDDHISFNHSMYLEETEEKDEYILTIIIDNDFLTNKNVTYPVTIDPTITVPSYYIDNAFVGSNFPSWTFKNGYSLFQTGYDTNGYFGETEAFTKLTDISSYAYISPNNINSATYNIYEITNSLPSNIIELYDINSIAWQCSTVTYSNSRSLKGAYVSGYSYNNQQGSFGITSLFKAWLKNSIAEGGFSKDYGFNIKAKNLNTPLRAFYSANGPVGMTPTITVNYNEDNSINDNVYYIKNKSNGWYLDAEASGNRNVITWPAHGEKNQQWKIIYEGSGFYTLYCQYPYYSGLALDTDTTSTITNADLYTASSHSWTKFRIVKNADNTYRIMSTYGDPNRGLTDGSNSNCNFSPYTGLNNQKWELIEVEGEIEKNAVTMNSVQFKLTYPVSGAPNNRLRIQDTVTGKWTEYDSSTLSNGTYSFDGLVPDRKHTGEIRYTIGNNTISKQISVTTSKVNKKGVNTTLNIPDTFFASVTQENVNNYIKKVDAAYSTLVSVLGKTPPNNELIVCAGSLGGNYEYPGWTFSGGNAIYINDNIIVGMLKEVGSKDDNEWDWVTMHEMGHVFEFDKRCSFGNSEPAANNNVYLSLKKAEGKFYNFGGDLSVDASGFKLSMHKKTPWSYVQSFGANPAKFYGDGFTYIYADLCDFVGIKHFESTYKKINMMTNSIPTSAIDQFNLFMTTLRDYSNIDVLARISDRDKGVIGEHFGGEVRYNK